MADYTPPDIETDAAALKDSMVEVLQAGIPGLTVQDGHPLNFILDGVAEIDADHALLLQASMDEGFSSIGKNLLRTPQATATQASGTATFTATDTAGHTIPAGTRFTLAGLDDSRVGFETTAEATIPAAGVSVAGVPFAAVVAGAAGSGLQTDAQLEDALTWIDTVTVDALTTGGEDAEDDDAYRNRLADTTQLLASTLVIARDYEIDARNNVAGVARALALDGYNPGDNTYSNEGMIAVAVVDASGVDPGSGVRDAGEARQTDLSVAQMTVNWITATYTTIAVVFAAKCYPEFDPADVEARAEAAVLAFLSPANWGLRPFGDQRDWVDKPVVRYRDVVAVIENVEGLDYTTSVTVNAGTADVTMTGPAAMPGTASTAAGTVTAP